MSEQKIKERPILFSAPMVRALLDGTKTQTRRICKNKVYSNGFHFDGHDILCHSDYLPPSAMLMDVRRGKDCYTVSNLEGWEVECPYGLPGDRLWVRETHFVNDLRDPMQLDADARAGLEILYRATDEQWLMNMEDTEGLRWAPSIHMPRWASRINLEITGVRVERLQDISELDALEEGVAYNQLPDNPLDAERARTWYRGLWEMINGPGSWEANPWVWVIQFSMLEARKK